MTIKTYIPTLTAEQKFMCSVIIVNGGNYLYNLLLGRVLGPELFADAALLITFLLVLSFVAMTFQLATAKFSVLFEKSILNRFINLSYRYASLIGIILGVLVIVFANDLQILFNTKSAQMFTLFGIGIPIYFIMSINRGVFQGTKKFSELAITYQSEMISRLLFTLLLIYVLPIQPIISIAIGIVLSFVFSLLPFKTKGVSVFKKQTLPKKYTKHIIRFFMLTAFYELTQIIINNSDILLVKHYFEEYEAGLYASLALIGRVVYFVAWMFVMLLLPKVVQKQKDGEATAPVLFKYVGYITILSACIVLGCYLFPETVVNLMFGSEYISIAPLLWKYAIATSLFAIANIFAYYYLSLDKYIPVLISGLLGISQLALIIWFHDSLHQVVMMQIISMTVLLIIQLLYFFYQTKRIEVLM
ncbi:oligosaccharide flippase family protein [uncultured Aquimarina sp.]|uniref:oligosaccharide flippase family protein n=1 Tax=uncultured Aquimarina sp. TaxID=575652 RepID=UPI0026102CBC|nr:oligosaccharide flippase family protein [uncultured Aquimarina sp.]